jgi:hypothetical protein
MAPLLAPLGFAHGRVSSFLPALLCLPRAKCPGPSARCSSPWPALGPSSAPKLPLLATPAWPEFLPPPARRRTDCGLLLQLRHALCPSLLFPKFGRVEFPSVHGRQSSSSQPRPLLPASRSLLLCEPLPVPSRFLLAWPERPALCSPSQVAVFPAHLACSSSCAVRRQAPACAVLCPWRAAGFSVRCEVLRVHGRRVPLLPWPISVLFAAAADSAACSPARHAPLLSVCAHAVLDVFPWRLMLFYWPRRGACALGPAYLAVFGFRAARVLFSACQRVLSARLAQIPIASSILPSIIVRRRAVRAAAPSLCRPGLVVDIARRSSAC